MWSVCEHGPGRAWHTRHNNIQTVSASGGRKLDESRTGILKQPDNRMAIPTPMSSILYLCSLPLVSFVRLESLASVSIYGGVVGMPPNKR